MDHKYRSAHVQPNVLAGKFVALWPTLCPPVSHKSGALWELLTEHLSHLCPKYCGNTFGSLSHGMEMGSLAFMINTAMASNIY